MVKKRGEWEDYYQKTPVSEMPWYHEGPFEDAPKALFAVLRRNSS